MESEMELKRKCECPYAKHVIAGLFVCFPVFFVSVSQLPCQITTNATEWMHSVPFEIAAWFLTSCGVKDSDWCLPCQAPGTTPQKKIPPTLVSAHTHIDEMQRTFPFTPSTGGVWGNVSAHVFPGKAPGTYWYSPTTSVPCWPASSCQSGCPSP